MGLDPQETPQPFYLSLIPFLPGDLLDPLVKPLYLCRLFLLGRHVFLQRFPIQSF